MISTLGIITVTMTVSTYANNIGVYYGKNDVWLLC